MPVNLAAIKDFQLGYIHGFNSQWCMWSRCDMMSELKRCTFSDALLSDAETIQRNIVTYSFNCFQPNVGPTTANSLMRLRIIDATTYITSYGDVLHRWPNNFFSVISTHALSEIQGLVSIIPTNSYNEFGLYRIGIPKTCPVIDRFNLCFEDANSSLSKYDDHLNTNEDILAIIEHMPSFSDTDFYTAGFTRGSEYVDDIFNEVWDNKCE